MKKVFILIFWFTANAICNNAIAQSPANDANWVLDTAKSDEFNGSAVNRTKWHVLDCPSGDCCNWGGSTAFERGNAVDSGGILYLRTDGPGGAPMPCSGGTFATGGITSDSSNYSYGYFEMYAKLPGFIDGGGVAHADKFWPTFWMFYNPNCSIHNEIDIMDECCCAYKDAETTGSGWSEAGPGADSCKVISAGAITNVSTVPLCNAFHKYAVEWNSNRIIFYRDDVPYFENYNQPSMKMNPMKILMSIQLSSGCSFYPGTPFPQFMQIDYFRYYKLNLDCGTSSTILSNTDLANYVFSVKSSIVLGSTGSIISLNPTDNKCFRAVNTITVSGDFTAPLGSQFTLIPSACN
ncbi:MAG TPA: glycoside hydrolase family 16 protein [Bacteroidia bacterium]|jgi:beta-glucanase (GH16 family)|nr:glycoside hydrolase family 16 protein [Bacteroidia bacterium]